MGDSGGVTGVRGWSPRSTFYSKQEYQIETGVRTTPQGRGRGRDPDLCVFREKDKRRTVHLLPDTHQHRVSSGGGAVPRGSDRMTGPETRCGEDGGGGGGPLGRPKQEILRTGLGVTLNHRRQRIRGGGRRDPRPRSGYYSYGTSRTEGVYETGCLL